ncbi:MAG: hypothetical protein ACJ748_02345 [Flavisolibacter sp.]
MIVVNTDEYSNFWEAWLDFDDLNLDQLTLYVMGEINLEKRKKEPLPLKKISLSNDTVLKLELCECDLIEDGYVQEAFYMEKIQNGHQYASIEIYANSIRLAKLNKIEWV